MAETRRRNFKTVVARSGVDAVIDKNLAAALLAREVAADALLILADVPQACIDYNTPEQQALGTVTLAEMQAYAAAGHFKAGSMGPMVAACLRFLEAGGATVIDIGVARRRASGGRA